MSNLAFSSVKGRRLSAYSIPNTSVVNAIGEVIHMPQADFEWDYFGLVAGGQQSVVSSSRVKVMIARIPASTYVLFCGFAEWAINATGTREFGMYRDQSSISFNYLRCKPAASIPTRQNFLTLRADAVANTFEPMADQNSGAALNVNLCSLAMFVAPGFNAASAQVTRLRRTSAQPITTGGTDIAQPIIWNAEDSNPLGWFSNASPTRITFDRTCYVKIASGCKWTANATGDRSLVANFNDAGAARIISGDSCDSASSSITHSSALTAIQRVDAGDYLELPAYHDRGSDLDITGASVEVSMLYEVV